MIISFLILVIAIQSVLLAPVSDDLIISLPDGQVQGTTYTTDNNKTFYGFQGIPYAKPPLGDLRFEAPQPPEPWNGVWDATKDSNACLSALNNIYKDAESEDCLYITVYTPSLKPADKLPVMFWIYGGGFIVGSARKGEYGPDFLLEEDIIFVSFNYRLGAFGFLSTGDSAIVGNAGLKDQALALKWAHNNVEYFGGDPEKITVFGESAGGASVGLQLVNRKIEGLFRAAIVQSGSALTNFTIDINPKSYADLLTTKLGGEMYLNDTQKMKTLLKEKTALEISNAQNLLVPKSKVPLQADYTLPRNQPFPVVEVENEDAFLTESPYELLESGRFNQVPIITGICANEALMIYGDLETVQQEALFFDNSPKTMIPRNLRQNSSDDDIIIKTIKSMYLREGESFSSNLAALSHLGSAIMFTKGVAKHAQLAARYVPVYLYQFSYYGRAVKPFLIPGVEKASHGAELPFLFKERFSNTTDPDDILTQTRIARLWANFAKYLNPTPERTELLDIIWPVMTENELQFLNINATLDIRSPLVGENYKKWNDIYDTYGKKPFITF